MFKLGAPPLAVLLLLLALGGRVRCDDDDPAEATADVSVKLVNGTFQVIGSN